MLNKCKGSNKALNDCDLKYLSKLMQLDAKLTLCLVLKISWNCQYLTRQKSCTNNIFLFSDHVIYKIFYYENLESYDILYQVNAYLISFCFVYNKGLLSYSMHMQVVLSV